MKNSLAALPFLIVFPLGAFFFSSTISKFIWATLGLLILMKVGALIRNRINKEKLPQGLGWLFFLFLWPGMRPENFYKKVAHRESVGRNFAIGFLFCLLGLATQVFLVFNWESIHAPLRIYIGLISFLFIVHFGISAMMFTVFRLIGWKVEPLFVHPLLSTSLRDFWSRRWNLAFVDMDKRIFLPLFPKAFPKPLRFAGIFLISGLLHELAISYPVNAGWGWPLIYFLIHGLLTWVEPKVPFIKNPILGRLWVWMGILLPLPLLFHHPFLNVFVEPYFLFCREMLSLITLEEFLSWALFLSGWGHFLVLIASFQVPNKLNWHEELSRLGRFNRKVFWTYGGYIVFCIVSFGIIDLIIPKALMEQNPSSMAIATFVTLFWTARIIIDFGYFKHDDWPKGDEFVIGHTCLTALFSFLAITHGLLLARQWALFS